MKKVFSVLLVMFLFACGGGGSYSGSSGPSASGAAPSGNFSGQVDPVQTK